jgi:hypothetical protein
MDEGYLRTQCGENWKLEQEKAHNEFEFYHNQLVPIAQKILDSIVLKKIDFIKIGEYNITYELIDELESDQIIAIKHKRA